MTAKKMEDMSAATRARYSKPQPYRGFIARFPQAILAVTAVSQYGTTKHEVPLDDYSYLDVPDAEVNYIEAECRHILKEVLGGPYDEDGDDLLHKAEKAWNAMADLERALRNLPLRKPELTPAGGAISQGPGLCGPGEFWFRNAK